MKFNIVEGVLFNATINTDMSQSAIVMRECANIALGVFRKSPKFRIQDIDALKPRFLDAITTDEITDITKYLPFTSFSIVEPSITTFVISGNPVDPQDTGVNWTFMQMLDQPNERSALLFCPHFVTINEDRTTSVAWLDPSTDIADSKTQESANEAFGHVLGLLIALSVFSKQIITVRPPERLAKKRAKNGKYPLYEYRVLRLDLSIAPSLPVKYRSMISGRLPPRTHLRRGHWATRDNKRYFRRSCIVNAKVQHTRGRIAKDYDVQ